MTEETFYCPVCDSVLSLDYMNYHTGSDEEFEAILECTLCDFYLYGNGDTKEESLEDLKREYKVEKGDVSL